MTTDERARSFAVLAANVLAVAHEQRRLQADITAAMDAGLLTAGQIMDEVLPNWSPALLDRRRRRDAGEPLQRIVRRVWQQLPTQLMMTLRVPGAVLHLHEDVPPAATARASRPSSPSSLDTPEEIGAAVAVYRVWDRTGGTGLHDGAQDWAVLHERMSYIVNLFRGRQQDATLSAHPFTDEQLVAMRAGRSRVGRCCRHTAVDVGERRHATERVGDGERDPLAVAVSGEQPLQQPAAEAPADPPRHAAVTAPACREPRQQHEQREHRVGADPTDGTPIMSATRSPMYCRSIAGASPAASRGTRP